MAAKLIVYAEDNRDDAVLLQYALRRSEVDADVRVLNGAACLKHLQDGGGGEFEMPDLVLLDLKMPDLDGQDILRSLRGIPRLRRTPIVVFSGALDSQTARECMESGATACIAKPFLSMGWRAIAAQISRHLSGPSAAEAPTPH